MNVFALALGGALGTLSRYGLGKAADRVYGGSYPLGTTLVNLLGCFFFGLAFAVITAKGLSHTHKLFVITGFMGAFTTFSTYMFESHSLVTGQRLSTFLISVGLQNIVGFFLVYVGLVLGSKACGTTF